MGWGFFSSVVWAQPLVSTAGCRSDDGSMQGIKAQLRFEAQNSVRLLWSLCKLCYLGLPVKAGQSLLGGHEDNLNLRFCILFMESEMQVMRSPKFINAMYFLCYDSHGFFFLITVFPYLTLIPMWLIRL
jgi:hypothetical protein